MSDGGAAVQKWVAEYGTNLHRLNYTMKYKFVQNVDKVKYVNQMGNLGMDRSTVVSAVWRNKVGACDLDLYSLGHAPVVSIVIRLLNIAFHRT